MTRSGTTVIYPVKDLAQAKQLYGRLLDVDPSMDEVYDVQFNTAHQEIGLDPNGHGKGMTGPVGYWHVDDIKTSVAQHRSLQRGASALVIRWLRVGGAAGFRPRQRADNLRAFSFQVDA